MHFPGGNKETQERLQSGWLVSLLKFELSASRIEVYNYINLLLEDEYCSGLHYNHCMLLREEFYSHSVLCFFAKEREKMNSLELTVLPRSSASKLEIGKWSLAFKLRATFKIRDVTKLI